MRVLAEIGARGVDGQRPVTLVRLVSQAERCRALPHSVLESASTGSERRVGRVFAGVRGRDV